MLEDEVGGQNTSKRIPHQIKRFQSAYVVHNHRYARGDCVQRQSRVSKIAFHGDTTTVIGQFDDDDTTVGDVLENIAQLGTHEVHGHAQPGKDDERFVFGMTSGHPFQIPRSAPVGQNKALLLEFSLFDPS